MTNNFPATLLNGVITWGANGAPPIPTDEARKVEIVVAPPERPNNDERTRRRMELLRELVRRNTFGHIEDPVEYIRELGRDPPMEGREE